MRSSSLLAYALLPVVLSTVARPPSDYERGDNRGDDDDDSNSVNPSATSSASESTSSDVSSGLNGDTGDSQCSNDICISAVVNGGTVQYVLQSTGSNTLGWMAMGFGSQMTNSPMVIMWANSDSSVTLSQRIASGRVEPSVDSSPPRAATLLSNLTSTSGAQPTFAYSVPVNSDTTQSIIWAVSSTNPDDPSASASLQIHDSSGVLSLDLTKALSSGSSGSGSSTSSAPLQGFQRLVIAHAVILGVAFLILLPAGALLARWLRTISPHWFMGHWIIQFYLAGALITIGVALGIAAVSQAGAPHLNDDHKRWGIAIFVLYFLQCGLGGVIHFLKPTSKADGSWKRPPQNYLHAIVGLFVIALAFYQVRTGYKDEWRLIGRGAAPKGVETAWITWTVILPILYSAGLVLLPRQYRQERRAQTGRGVPVAPLSSDLPLTQSVNVGRPANGAIGLTPVEDNRDDGASSHAHGDPYADDIGLTSSGRRSRRNDSGGHRVSLPSHHF